MAHYDSNNNSNNQIIYLWKERPKIFNQHYQNFNKKLLFQDIYNNPIFNELSFLMSDNQQCECLNQLNQCVKLKGIINENMKRQAKYLFQQLKQTINHQNRPKKHVHNKIFQKLNQSSKYDVLQPHFNNLLIVLDIQYPQILMQILKHAKSDYITFWLYGAYCKKLPSYQVLKQNIITLTDNLNLSLDINKLISKQKPILKQILGRKLFGLIRNNFISVLGIILKSQRKDAITEKIVICMFVQGKTRNQCQVIRASIQM